MNPVPVNWLEEVYPLTGYGTEIVCEACGGAGAMDDGEQCDECRGTGEIRHT